MTCHTTGLQNAGRDYEVGHARFSRNGSGFDPVMEREYPKGTNAIHMIVFWNVPLWWAKASATRHGAALIWEKA